MYGHMHVVYTRKRIDSLCPYTSIMSCAMRSPFDTEWYRVTTSKKSYRALVLTFEIFWPMIEKHDTDISTIIRIYHPSSDIDELLRCKAGPRSLGASCMNHVHCSSSLTDAPIAPLRHCYGEICLCDSFPSSRYNCVFSTET